MANADVGKYLLQIIVLSPDRRLCMGRTLGMMFKAMATIFPSGHRHRMQWQDVAISGLAKAKHQAAFNQMVQNSYTHG